MITIIKDGETIRCSENTYKTMFKRLGYEIVKPKETKETKVKKEKETFDEIPVIEMEKEPKIVSKSKVGKRK